MIVLMPCEYCGKQVPWSLSSMSPPCCPECAWIPKLVVCAFIVVATALLVAVAAIITYGVH